MKNFDNLRSSCKALYRANFSKIKTPIILSWQVTDTSNAGKPCYQNQARTEKELSPSEVIDVIDRIAQAGVRRVILTGGDPMMRFDIGSIMDQLHEKNISVHLETHGYFVERKIEIVKLADKVFLPLDGPEEIQDELRYIGSYQEVLQAAKVLAANKRPFVFVCTLTSKNIDLLESALEVAGHFKTGIYFEPVPPLLDGTKTAHPLIFSSDRMKRAMIRLIRLKKAQYPNVLNSEESLNHIYHWPESSMVHCESSWICAHIDVNGDLIPCGYVRPRVRNNILKDGLVEAFNKLSAKTCTDCWQAYRFDLHKKTRFSVNNIFNLFS
ncbi:MAG: radical SAM protein [bacterium]